MFANQKLRKSRYDSTAIYRLLFWPDAQKMKFEEGKLKVHAPGSRIYKATLQSPLKLGGNYTVIYAVAYLV